MTSDGGSGNGGGAGRRALGEYLNLFLGLAGLLFAVYFIDAPWILRLGFLAVAGVLAWVLLEVLGGRLLSRARTGRLVLAGLVVMAVAVAVIGVRMDSEKDDPGSGTRDEGGGPTTPSECRWDAGDLTAGESDVEAAQYRDAFRAAYVKAGGREELGCPANLVDFTFGAGVHQRFERGGAEGALLAVDPQSVVWVEPSVSRCVEEAAGAPGDVFRITAYPKEGPREVEGGWVLVLGYSRNEPVRPNAVVRQDDGDICAWVTHDFWLKYEAMGGPEGYLGYPTGNKNYNAAGVEEQRFEHSCLARHSTEVVRATCGVPAPGASTPATTAAPAASELAYKVSAPPDSVSVPIGRGGYIEQLFVPRLPGLVSMAVNAAWNPAEVTGHKFSLVIEVRDTSGTVVADGRADVTETNMNRDISVAVGDVELVPGDRYFLRAVNASTDKLGIRLADPDRAGNRVEPDTCAWVVAQLGGEAEPAVGPHCALAGFVEVARR